MSSTEQIVTINVAGELFQTYDSTLARYPDSLLGNQEERSRFLNPSTEELYFDRNSDIFESILYFYQSGGSVCNTSFLAMEKLIEELEYFRIGEEYINEYETKNGLNQSEKEFPKCHLMRIVWTFMEYPESSLPAKLFATQSALVTMLTITLILLETVPNFFHPHGNFDGFHNITNLNTTGPPPLYIPFSHATWVPSVNLGAIIWFTSESLIRFMSCPNKLYFFTTLRNWIDIISVLPFYTELFIHVQNSPILGIIRIIRYVNILKLSRFSNGVRILLLTLKAASEELLTLSFLLAISILLLSSCMFFAEHLEAGTKFTSIPHSAWWAIVSLSTAGFGDMFPTTVVGKLIGCFTLLVGVVMISLPIPTVVTNFTYFYEQDRTRQAACYNKKSIKKLEKRKERLRKGMQMLIPRASRTTPGQLA